MKIFFSKDKTTLYWVDDGQPRALQVLNFLTRKCEDITDLWNSGVDMLIITGILHKDLPEVIKQGVRLVEVGASLWHSYDTSDGETYSFENS